MLKIRLYLSLACVLAGMLGLRVCADEPVEKGPLFFVRDLLPDLELKTEVYSVAPMVEVKSFGYEFRISSDHGDYTARGMQQLDQILHELRVIEKLSEITQTGAFASSLSGSFTDPVSTTLGVARRPLASVTGLPGGVVRYLGGKVYQVRRGSGKAMDSYRDFRSKDDSDQEADEDDEKSSLGSSAGKLSRKHLGFESAKRKWARKLAVDPYSDNTALQQALGRIAWASTLGGFAGDFAVPSSEVFSYAGKARELVWDRPAYQIERELVSLLKKRGVSKELIHAFRDAPVYSLTEKMELCLSLESFAKSEDVAFILEYALRAESEEDAKLLIRTVSVLVKYTHEVSGIASVGERRGMLYAISNSGYEIYPLAVDYLHWTPLVYEALLSEDLKAPKREIWVSGNVSPIAKHRLEANDWLVFAGVGP